jgi:hypothetical protein
MAVGHSRGHSMPAQRLSKVDRSSRASHEVCPGRSYINMAETASQRIALLVLGNAHHAGVQFVAFCPAISDDVLNYGTISGIMNTA